jgi:hypothetical protein
MDTVNSAASWDEAMSRLLAFLAAMHIGGVEHRTRVALSIINQAQQQHALKPEGDPVEQTMTIALHDIEQWFDAALENVEMPVGRRVAAGIVGLRVTDAINRWPDAVLDGPPPSDLKATLARVSFRTGPDLAVSSMTPRTMDYGAMETIAQETWHRFAWLPIVRAAMLWTVIFFVALYTYDHFYSR